MSSEGIHHCGRVHLFRDLQAEIRSDGFGGLLWLWRCGTCDSVLRQEPFAYPPDFPEPNGDPR